MSIDTNPQQKYKNPGIATILGGILVGSIVQGGVTTIPSYPGMVKIFDKMRAVNDLPDDEFKKINESIVKVLKDTGLGAKGVSIRRVPTQEIASFLQKCLIMPKYIEATKYGYNSYYIFDRKTSILEKTNAAEVLADINPKTIYIPEKKLSLTAFHEMGHAANEQFSKTGKFLQKCRHPLMRIVLPLIALIALCKTKKAPGEKPKKTTDKINTFIKNNAGKLAFLATVPIFIEEAMASIKGYKFAREAGLSKDLLAKVAKTNKLGFSIYLGTSILGSLGLCLGIKVKDAIAHKKPKKIKPKVQV